jgi:hypothetical protein
MGLQAVISAKEAEAHSLGHQHTLYLALFGVSAVASVALAALTTTFLCFPSLRHYRFLRPFGSVSALILAPLSVVVPIEVFKEAVFLKYEKRAVEQTADALAANTAWCDACDEYDINPPASEPREEQWEAFAQIVYLTPHLENLKERFSVAYPISKQSELIESLYRLAFEMANLIRKIEGAQPLPIGRFKINHESDLVISFNPRTLANLEIDSLDQGGSGSNS